MKTTRTSHPFLILGTLLILLFATAVTAYAATKNYNGVTTVTYNNTIVDSGGSGWSPGHADTTNPVRVMDQFGKNVWTTYNSCNYNLVPQSWLSYQIQNNPWMMQHNVSSAYDSMARSKIDCAIGQVQRGHNYLQHYWQDAEYPGSGGTLDTSKILTNP